LKDAGPERISDSHQARGKDGDEVMLKHDLVLKYPGGTKNLK
jgi:hypothetical protein